MKAYEPTVGDLVGYFVDGSFQSACRAKIVNVIDQNIVDVQLYSRAMASYTGPTHRATRAAGSPQPNSWDVIV